MNAIQFRFAGGLALLACVVVCSCATTKTATVAENKGVAVDGAPGEFQTLGALTSEQSDFSKALAHYASGILLHGQGNSNEALQDWEQVARLDPSRSELREKIVQEYFRKSEFKKAAEMLEIATRQDPRSFSYWTLLAIAYRSDKQWEKAREAAETALRLDAAKFPPYEVLFEVAIESHDPKGAKKVLDRAAREKSEDYYFWVRLADLYLALNSKEKDLGIDLEKIVQYYDKAVALNPKDAAVLARVADFYVVHQNLPKAIQLYQKILAEQPNAENVRLKLALTFVAQDNRKQAVETLEQIVKNEPFRYQVFSLIGELYEDMKDPDRALTNYRLSLSANPKQVGPYLKMILLEMRSKHSEEAFRLLGDAREKFPNTPQISYFYGLAYSESKDFARAVESMEEARRVAEISSPEMLDAVFYFYYGAALERNGQFDKAVEQFNKAIEINPDYADAHNYLGFMYADKNIKLDEAERLVGKALAYEPANGAFLDSMGWVYYRQGKFQKAVEYLQQAAKVIDNDAVIFEHLGDLYSEMGKQAEALQAYQKAVELDPNLKEAALKLDKVKNALSSSKPVAVPAAGSR